jgi:hypothetical protein
MNKLVLLFLFLSFTGFGCSRTESKLVETQQRQIDEQAKQIKELENKISQVSSNKDKSNEDSSFLKNIECKKYEKDIKKEYNSVSVSVFYSPYKETCVAEIVGVKDGQITNKMLLNIFTNIGYVSEQSGQILRDSEFDSSKSFNDIRDILLKNRPNDN